MPQKSCMDCLSKLYAYAQFKEQSHSVDAKLRQIVLKKRKLAEAQALYGPVFADLDASFSSSFETAGDRSHDICSPGLPTEEDLRTPNQEKSCLKLLKVEGSWHDNSLTDDSESNISETKIFNILESLPDSGLQCSEEESIANAANFVTEICSTSKTLDNPVNTPHAKGGLKTSKTKSAVVNPLSSTCTTVTGTQSVTLVENQTQNDVADDPSCPDVIHEIIVPDNSTAEEDSDAVDFVPDVPVFEVLSPDIIPLDSAMINCSSRLPTPEVFAIVGQQDVKHLGFRCPLCKKVFHSRIQFRKHASFHVRSKGGVCKYCEKWFQTSNALYRHERIHSGEKPFLCILCDRSFSQREILQRHILTHTDNKPFQCQHCDKSYAQKSGLDSHVKNHHKPTLEISQYPCILCDKAFCHPSGLSRHMLTHSGKQYVCKFCKRNFSDSSALRRHTKKQHGSLP
ncbi:myoneurin-like isoform X2 [Thrips palmi]|nr:myoneurin-like isoform X2 [Thrips palmi]